MTAGQWASGNQNVQIQGVGAGASIQVSIGGEAPVLLPLRAATVTVGLGVQSPARLLRARSGVLPFVDRAGLLAGLTEWMASPVPYATYLVGGRGGSGKTRLGVHLCALAEARNWVAGLLADDTDPAQVAALVRVPAPRLVVIDYAETRVEQLEVLLPALAAHATAKWPIRVLLLVRSPPRTGRDWTERLRAGASDELEQILDDTDVQLLASEDLSPADRQALFDTATEVFARRVDSGQSAGPSRTTKLGPVDLADAGFATPLLIMIAAYLAVHDPDRSVPATRLTLLTGLARHEDRYWQDTARAARMVGLESAVLRGRVVAVVGLLGADTESEAVEYLDLLPELAGDAAVGRRHEVARWAHGLYAGPRWWNPVEPDLLAEYLVANTLIEVPDLIEQTLRIRHDDALARALALFTRAVVDHQSLATAVQRALNNALVDLCRSAVVQTTQRPELRLLLGVPSIASTLARLLEVASVDESALREASDVLPGGANQILTPLALAATNQLVEQYRGLAAANPAAYEPDLAKTLSNWSNRLGEVGRRADGLAAIEEAVEIRRRLAAANPAAYEPDLAKALNNWSIHLADAGRTADGLAAVEEAVEVYRRLTAANPAAHEPDFAMVLNNWSTRLVEAGRRADGLAAVEEAVEVYRRLAAASPAAYELDLAMALNNWSTRLAEAGRSADGLAAVEEAVEIRRRLAAANPAAYELDLAKALNNWSIHLAMAGRSADGLAAVEEAVEVYRRLAAAGPAAHEPDFAKTLSGWSNRLADLGRSAEGLAAAEEVVEIRRRLTAANPAAHEPDLAKALINWAIRLVEVGRRADALAAAEEAVEIRKRLAAADPVGYESELGSSLQVLGALTAADRTSQLP